MYDFVLVMATQYDLYRLLRDWISDAVIGFFDDFQHYQSEFGRLEKDVFGDISARCKNPLAMKYDSVRNELVTYSMTKEDKVLETVKKNFIDIKEP
jgi:hypothetical protein